VEVAAVPGQPAAPAAAPAPGQPAVAPQQPAEPGQQGADPTQVQQPEPAAAPGPDPFLAARLGEIGDTMRGLLERIPAPQPEAEPNWAEQLGEIYGQDGIPDPQQLEGYIQQRIEHGVKTGTASLQGEIGQIRQTLSNQEIDSLEVTYPELKDPQVAMPVIERASQLADELSRTTGQQIPLTANLIRTAHLAHKAEALAHDETPAPGPGPAAQLETGGGGAPAPAAGEPNGWERIKQAGGGSSTAIF
jgi:hypothetical protein